MTAPRGIKRPEDEQQKIDRLTKDMVLYQFKTCPFCIKVRREIKRQSLNIELRDAQHDPYHRQQLLSEGGMVKVPCLNIKNERGQNTWLYESNDVIQFLRKLVA
jgi:glutaredoxin